MLIHRNSEIYAAVYAFAQYSRYDQRQMMKVIFLLVLQIHELFKGGAAAVDGIAFSAVLYNSRLGCFDEDDTGFYGWEQERDARIEKLVQAELEIEVGVELEEVSAMLNSRNPDLEALRMRLEAMEEKLLRLEPVLRQTGNPPSRTAEPATVSPPENRPPIPQQVVNQIILLLSLHE